MKIDKAVMLELARSRPASVLLFDIETTPIVGYVWQTYDTNVGANQVQRYSRILCFAAKWLGEPTIYWEAADQAGKGPESIDDRGLCRNLSQLLGAADVVVAHNGKAFDLKRVNARLACHNLPPPVPHKFVDTYLLAKHEFGFAHRSLDGIARELGVGGKLAHEGFSLWLRCMDGDKDAWKAMERYNIRDVELLEQIYLRMRPFDRKHPNVGLLHADGVPRCVCCGSAELRPVLKTARTDVSRFPMFQCRVCRKFMRSGTKLQSARSMRNIV